MNICLMSYTEIYQLQYENQLLRLLEEPTVIVMDNAAYHGRLVNHCPSNATKSQIQEFAAKFEIHLDPKHTIKTYREILEQNKEASTSHKF